MHIHVHIHDHRSDVFQDRIYSQLNKINMNIEEAVSKVNAQTEQLKKIAGEVTAIKDALAAAIAAGDVVPQALADAIDASGAEINVVDELNADAPVEAPAAPEA